MTLRALVLALALSSGFATAATKPKVVKPAKVSKTKAVNRANKAAKPANRLTRQGIKHTTPKIAKHKVSTPKVTKPKITKRKA